MAGSGKRRGLKGRYQLQWGIHDCPDQKFSLDSVCRELGTLSDRRDTDGNHRELQYPG